MSRTDPTATDPTAGALRVRASSPEDLLSLIPYLLGFRPENSLVTLLLRGGLLQLTARIDLPPVGADVDLGRVARHFAAVADRHGAHDAVVATFTSDATWSDRVVRRVDAALGRSGCDVVTALHCDQRRYRVRGPLGWTGPFDFDPQTTATAASAVVAGLGMLPDRAALVASVAPAGPAEVAAVVAAAEGVDLPDEPGARDALMAETTARCVADAGTVSDRDCAQLALLATDLEVRDVAWLAMDRATARRHRELWQQVARRVPTVLSAAPVCLTGMAAWLEGDGALAWCCVDRATAEHPNYGMGDLLRQLLESAVHPRTWDAMSDGMAAV